MPRDSLAELQSRVGGSRKTVEGLKIEAGKVKEFARAIKDDNPVFYDEEVAQERGHPAIPAPLTFTRTAYFPRYRASGIGLDFGFDLGMDPEYIVHGEQSYEFSRPAYVGDTLTGVTTFRDVYQRDGSTGGEMTFAVFETEYRDQHGDHVLTEQATRIETDGAIDEDDP
ncbi:FAS1-like dehydratase domain-containing protein [Halorarius halobius]|uniref:FAS1-like dehydratase domain-containing protein n=1 Tax=Halorarius halobius TaxID=2962671 RepID=UPI0020CC5F83|nr:MaoC family dehydratase N-terminal domain-containing protein [Halorarius halobius]